MKGISLLDVLHAWFWNMEMTPNSGFPDDRFADTDIHFPLDNHQRSFYSALRRQGSGADFNIADGISIADDRPDGYRGSTAQMGASTRRNLFNIILLIVIVIMGLEIVYLVYQNKKLQAMVAAGSSLQILQQGQQVPPLAAHDLDGAAVNISYDNDQVSTLLIWFSPSCHVCSENATFWNQLYGRYKSAKVRFLALCDAEAAEAKSYVTQNGLIFPAVSITEDRLIEAYNGRVMPQTALISPLGEIVKVWPGALEKSRQDEITAVLDSLTQ
jgi:peroxiredoxin